MGGLEGDWFLWAILGFAAALFIALWAGGYWDTPPADEVPAPVAVPIE